MQMMIENNQWADIQIRISHIYIKGGKKCRSGLEFSISIQGF